MKTSLYKKMLGVGLALGLILAASDASAITRDKLLQMAKVGLSDEEIIVLIDQSSPGELTFTEDETDELKSQGVSDAVLEHLRKTGHIKAKSDAAAQSSSDSPAGPAPATGDVGAPGQFAPAPADEDSQQLMTREQLDAEMKRRLQEEKRKSQDLAKIKRAATRLPEANKLLDADDNMAAAKIYLQILALDPAEGTQPYYEANYGVGKALFKEKIYSGASLPLLRVVREGPDQRHFKNAFEMFETISREINFYPPVLEELASADVSKLDEDFQSQFNFYMGRFFFDTNRSELAIKFFNKIPKTASKYPEAMYMQGAAKLDESVNDITGALRDFESAIRAAEKEKTRDSDILQLSYLALARTFYEAGFYDVALYYYQKLPKTSSRNADSMLEQAWAYFLKNDYKRALGIFHTLHSPYYSKWYYPDLYILEATVYLNLCMFEKSKLALKAFDTRYLSQKKKLDSFIAETNSPLAYWNAMMTAYKGKDSSKKESNDQGGIPRIFANAIVDDLQFFNTYKVIQRLAGERKALANNLSALGEYGQSVLTNVRLQLDNKIQDGGILVQQKLQQLSQQLGDWEIKATQISFDIDSEEKAQLEERLTNPNWKPAVIKPSGSSFRVVADDWEVWPFEGEYWLDESTNYRSGLRSQCVEK